MQNRLSHTFVFLKTLLLAVMVVSVTNCSRIQRWVQKKNLSPGQNAEDAVQNNAHLIWEMYQVVYAEEPRDQSLIYRFAEILQQGAKIEGIYNGFTRSAKFRKKEEEAISCASDSLAIFTEELARLELSFAVPRKFTGEDARPLPLPQFPAEEAGGVPGPKPVPSHHASIDPARRDLESLRKEYSEHFSRSSCFTLKRILGDEALRLLRHFGGDRLKQAAWYGRWAARLSGRKTDFGLPERNDPVAATHEEWALKNPVGSIQWEVLNRLHRLLNPVPQKPSKGKPQNES